MILGKIQRIKERAAEDEVHNGMKEATNLEYRETLRSSTRWKRMVNDCRCKKNKN